MEGGDLSEKVEGEEGVGLRRLNGDEPNIGEWDDMGRLGGLWEIDRGDRGGEG